MKIHHLVVAFLVIGSSLSVRQDKVLAQPLQVGSSAEAPAPATSAPTEVVDGPAEPQTSGSDAPVPTAETPAANSGSQTQAPVPETPAPGKTKSLAQSLDSEDESEVESHPLVGDEITSHRKRGLIIPPRPKPADDDDEEVQHLIGKPLRKPNKTVKKFFSIHSDVTKIVNGKGTRTIKDNINGKKSEKVIDIGGGKPKYPKVGKYHEPIEEFD